MSEALDDLLMAFFAGEVGGSFHIVVAGRGVRAMLEEHIDRFHIAILRGSVQCSPTTLLAGIHRRAILQ